MLTLLVSEVQHRVEGESEMPSQRGRPLRADTFHSPAVRAEGTILELDEPLEPGPVNGGGRQPPGTEIPRPAAPPYLSGPAAVFTPDAQRNSGCPVR